MNDDAVERQEREAERPAAGDAKPDDHDVKVVDRRWWARADAGQEPEGAALRKPTYVEELERQLADKDTQLQSLIAKYKEASAEFDTARIRLRREILKEIERGKRTILTELLDVVDNLDRAIEAARRSGDAATVLEGVGLVRDQFLAKLDGFGVTRMTVEGQPFDPARHEAASAAPTTDPALQDRVIGVIRHGYEIGGEVLRPAVVAVARLSS